MIEMNYLIDFALYMVVFIGLVLTVRAIERHYEKPRRADSLPQDSGASSPKVRPHRPLAAASSKAP